MLKVFIYLIIIIPTLLAGILLTIYSFQEHLIFYPDKLSDVYKFNFSIPFEEISIEVEKKVLINSIHFKSKHSKGVVFYHHGNAGNLQSWGNAAIYFVNLGYDVFMYDYRGYGKSTSKIKHEKELHADAKFLYSYLLKQYKEENIILFGASLGTGIAAKLAAENNPKKLVLETPYFNFYQVAKFHYPYIPTSWLLKYKLRTDRFIKEVKCYVYLIHGTEDLVVPYESSLKLKKVKPDAYLITIENGSHSNLDSFNEYHMQLYKIISVE
jgi:pimeloyl-ACP methyl ester carboxylesterase